MIVVIVIIFRSIYMSKIHESDFQELSLGCEGSMVLIAQKMLNSIGYKLKENGNFDEGMAHAVRDFQIENSPLVVNGIICSETMIAIDSAIAIQKER
jgi:peptidoglycan hydrolase-like protein with peptidoglycan-binding domain